MRSLEQWLDYQARLHTQAIDLGLERLRAVLDRLDWRQPKAPVITVAGTNGKGSVTAYCSAILAAAGYRVGTFTSPHLRDYRERIRIADRLVTAQELVAAFEKIDAARGDIGLTFFEFNALAAILIFEDAALDAWVLEIGLGGRLDAVNVVDPDVAVVVSIGLDHQEFLGSTLEAIAREKAGIFRAGRAAVIGSPEVPQILPELALRAGATLRRFGVDFTCVKEGSTWRYSGSRWDLPRLPPPALLGDVQYENAATAIAALEALDDRLPLDHAAVCEGLESVQLTGRFQRLATQPVWILDVAHNPDAARVLAHNLREGPQRGKTHAVFGLLADKDAAGIAAILSDCFDAWWCCSLDGARGQSGLQLAATVRAQVTAPVADTVSVAAACDAAQAAATRADRIVIFGSFHTVGPALDWLEAKGLYTAPPRVPPRAS